MRPFTITKSLTAPAATNIALSQSLAAAGNLILNGAAASGGVATLDSQRNVVITSAGDDSGLTWTVIGTDENGNPIKDVFAGANGAATSNLNFWTVTSITGSAATASTVTAGTGATGASPAKMFDDHVATPNMGFDLELVTGSGTASVQFTQEPFLGAVSQSGSNPAIAIGPASPNPTWHDLPSLGQESASAQGLLNFPVHAVRLNIVTGTGTWRLTGRQAGLASP